MTAGFIREINHDCILHGAYQFIPTYKAGHSYQSSEVRGQDFLMSVDDDYSLLFCVL